MPATVVERFLAASTGDRIRMARDPGAHAELERYFGPAAWEEYRRLADAAADGTHLGAGTPPNVVFVPGVMGSMLQGTHKPGIWWLDVRTRAHLKDLRLNAAGDASENPDNEVDPAAVDPSYEAFAVALLAQPDLGHRMHPYDWRKPLSRSTAGLAALVKRCHEENGRRPVHLVAHSMGGLLVRATLMEHGAALWPLLGRIVFVGTPHYGSPSIAGYLKNHLWGLELLAVLGRYLDRAAFRSLHGVLGMLPAPVGVYPGTRVPGAAHPCASFDLYQAAEWRLDLPAGEEARLQAVLDGAADFHRRMHAFHERLPQHQRDRMLVIAGVGYRTLFRLEYDPAFFGLWERMRKVTDRVPGDPHREGDGRVPLASAALENVQVRYVRGMHGTLTNIPSVSRDVFRWLRGQPTGLPDTPRGALSGHLAGDASPTPHLDGAATAVPFSDDPGYWAAGAVDEARLASLDREIDAGTHPQFAMLKIL